ncbi:hypothetical protein [Klebsiella phage vB_KpnS-VAC8]|uniref:Uncharacterized protein n=1 Tax=Klebsiella phage vB_KpnS-VAC8 TaxID=2864366 RepID=A0AAE7XII2_9CAUD|nr:hypothetical protein [Klebsiella phage vB_KpnS-VAC8]
MRLWIPLAQAIIFRCSAAKKCIYGYMGDDSKSYQTRRNPLTARLEAGKIALPTYTKTP